MPQPRTADLVVFLAVLATAAALVLRGTDPATLTTVTVAVSGLYAAWRGPGRKDRAGEGRSDGDTRER
ncbi:hypothetical protein ACIQRS_08555 [Streptomyces termitum]|uniref:Uncharacterized protein n=1 Tax=Streptomyces termitum TaxID=67368 RepID=A0A918SPS8_9ACTN|nr:hypothetical protein [Streptomyces termitum]GHA64429.1 hypothetical protein GCM10010305_02470 [Streptomyces termitum]